MKLTLSEYLLQDFEVEQVHSTLIELDKENKVRFPATSRVYFHLVLHGTALLELEEPGHAIGLLAGDFALLLYGAAHPLGNSANKHGKNILAHSFKQWKPSDEISVLKFGEQNQSSQLRVLSGALLLNRPLLNAPVNRALPHLLTYGPGRGPHNQETAPLCDPVQVEAACLRVGASAFVDALARLYLMQILRQVHFDISDLFPVHIGSPELGRIAAVVQKIRTNPAKRWTVATLAQEVGWSRSSFAAKFRTHTGQGPMQYVARTRLKHAATLLCSNPELSLWEIAKRVGYDTQGSLTRAFKAHYGVAPRHYTGQPMLTGDGQEYLPHITCRPEEALAQNRMNREH